MGYRVWALIRIRHQERFLDHFSSVFNFEYVSLVLVLYLPNGAFPKIVRLVKMVVNVVPLCLSAAT